MSAGIIASKNQNGELTIKITPEFRKKIIKSLKEKKEIITEADILEQIITETHHIASIIEEKK